MRNAIAPLLVAAACPCFAQAPVVDATTIHGKVMCGYQGWFRCPGDAANMGWVHWSRDSARIAPDTLTFEMWPDMSDYPEADRYPAPGFTYPDGSQATLFSSDSAAVVRTHFEWMREYHIDGAWLQHFAVDLPGGPIEARYPSRRRVLEHARSAAQATGRAWALSYDIAGTPMERIYGVVTADWKRMVDEGVVADDRYLHEGGRPVVQIWGFYFGIQSNRMSAELANRVIDFFAEPGPYSALLVGGGDWNWRACPDPDWRAFVHRFGAYCPWNIGNYTLDEAGVSHASTHYWPDDKAECEREGVFWIPVIYPGFSWDNLMQKPPGTTLIPRRKGQFLWEQFLRLKELGVDTVYVAMFDEVDEGTAVFKVTSSPPVEAHFVGYEGLPSDAYLQIVREGIALLRGRREPVPQAPVVP